MSRNQAKRSSGKCSQTMMLGITLLPWLLCLVLVPESLAQTWDFETGDLRGWTRTGTAFNNQPTFGDNVAARLPGTRSGHEGDYWIGTYENRRYRTSPAGGARGNGPTGRLVSDEFVIASPHLSFLIGGGNDFNRLRVELLVRIGTGRCAPPPPAAAILGLGGRERLYGADYFLGMYTTGRNREAMRREAWDLSNYLGCPARIRVKDDSSRLWGHINVDDFRFSSSPPTRVHVTNDTGAAVQDAEVYVNGVRAGVTDSSGNLSLDTLSTAHDLIARKLVFEKGSHRGNHSAGSTQNWSHRVYNTSAPVNDDGTVSAHAVTNPAAVQELRLSTENTIIGLNLVVSVEWDATAGELFDLRDNKIIPASQFLYNATDGQFFIEQVEIVDDAASWDEADYRIYANWNRRESANLDGFNSFNVFRGNGWMHMARYSGATVFIHEFGHYGFDVRDEYADGRTPGSLDPNVICTMNVNVASCLAGTDSTVADFGDYQPKASCIMWLQDCTNKLCSNHPANPHARGTRQGDTSCWSSIASKFRDRERDRRWDVRWRLRTPDTRGAIVGPLPAIIGGWRPRVSMNNRSRANFCQPFDWTFTNYYTGRLLGGAEVWNRTFYGQNILQGNTTMDNPDTPTDEGGRMTVTGVHVGDRLRVGGGEYVVSGRCIRASLDGRPGGATLNGPQLASLRPSTLGSDWFTSTAAFNPLAFARQRELQVIEVQPPFDVRISFEPTAVAGQALVRVWAGVNLSGAPTVEFSLTGSTRIEAITMRFDAATRTYVGLVHRLRPDVQASVQATAVDTAGRSVTHIVAVSLSPIVPGDETELFSADGQLSLTIPAGALPRGARVAIGPGALPPPPVYEGAELLSGPFNVSASTPSLNRSAVLRFQLPRGTNKRSAASVYHPKSFEVFRYNPATTRWERAGGTFLEGVEIVTLQVSELGTYVLTARRLTAPPAKKFDVTAISLHASPSKYQGSCPAIISFNGIIEASGPGTVRYTFTRSDGAVSPVQTLTFKSAGQLAVSNTWSIGGASLPSYSGWQAVRILSPTLAESAKANFTVQCAK